MKKSVLLLVLLISGVMNYAWSQTVTGTVTDASDGSGIPGVAVMVKGTSVGGVTDFDGKYSVNAAGSAVLVFSFVGYQTAEVAVNNQSEVNVQMKMTATDLDEVVVIGYGTQKKSLLTGSISKVDADEMVKGNSLRVNQAIQGKTAGVVVMNNSGQPGDFVSVRIRGTGTNGDSEPLYIVDGLPTNGYGIDYLNASDIESIEVLKDAASAAIYGTRGANGVVLITTKSGSKGKKFEVSYEGYKGYQNPWRKMSVLNKDQYIEMINESMANAGQTPKYTDQAVIDTLSNTDWQDKMFYYNAPKVSHTLSMTGGSENASYASSLSYFKQDGIVGEGQSNFERLTYRLNSTREFGIMTVGANFNYANIKAKGIDANDRYGVSLVQAVNMPPVIAYQYSDGSWGLPHHYSLGMQEITNPNALLSIRNSESNTDKIIGGLSADFDFGKLIPALEGLKFRTAYSTEFAYVNWRNYDPIYNFGALKYSIINRVSNSIDKWARWNVDNVLSYDKTFGENHINVIVGHAAFKDWHENVSASKADVIFDDFEHAYLNNATDDLSTTANGTYGEHTVLSYFGRANYDLKSKYMISATLRVDGSSRFGSSNKFASFPSVSAGWIVSEEAFFPSSLPINFFKLRGSWGRNGNENIGDFAYTTTIANGAIYYFGTTPVQYNGTVPSRIPNPNLRWETSEQTNFGFDMGIFNSKLSIGFDYYIKRTLDWLVEAPAPAMIGNSRPIINGGEIKNSGIEFEITHKNRIGGLTYDLSFTGAMNKNEMVAIENAEKLLQGGTGGFGQEGIKRAEIGTPLGFFYGYEVEGVFQNWDEVNAYVDAEGDKIQPNAAPGDFKFKDQNGDKQLTDAGDKVNLGNSVPAFTGGINFNVTWKGVDFNMFWYTALGHKIWMAQRRYDQAFTNYTTDWYENRWTGEGSTNEYPRITHVDVNNNLKTPSDFYVEDGSYVRLKNISLGYTLPATLTKQIKVAKVRVYVAGENMLTFTKYPGFEPEIGGHLWNAGVDTGIYPQPRTVTGGVNITF